MHNRPHPPGLRKALAFPWQKSGPHSRTSSAKRESFPVLSRRGRLKINASSNRSSWPSAKRKSAPDGSSLYSIVESRELTAVDGKASAKNAKMPTAPLLFDGLAVNVLFISDVPRYQTGQAPNLDGRLTIRIGFTTRKSQEFLQLEFPAAVSGVQIDTQSSKTLHVDSRLGSMHGGRRNPGLSGLSKHRNRRKGLLAASPCEGGSHPRKGSDRYLCRRILRLQKV